MFVAVWDLHGVDRGYLNLDKLVRFKLESETKLGATKHKLIAKSATETTAWQISGNSAVNIQKSMGKHAF